MKFEMMAIDRNRQLESCKRFLIMDLESIEKMQGMIDEEFFGFDRKSIKEEKACL